MNNLLTNNWKEIGPFHKYDRIIRCYSLILYKSYDSQEKRALDIELFLSKIEELRYELSYNKATESNSGYIDVTLTILALNVAALVFKGSELKKYVDWVLYYEKNDELIEIYRRMLD